MGSLQGKLSAMARENGGLKMMGKKSLPGEGGTAGQVGGSHRKNLEGQAVEAAPREKLKHTHIMEQSTEQLQAQQDPGLSL